MRRGSRGAVLVAVVAVATVLGLVFPHATVLAHTELVHWDLAGGTAGQPQQLRLRFSEPIDSKFLTVSIFPQGGSGTSQPVNSVRIDPQRRTDGVIDLPGLASGVYSVAWWTRALDGDPSNGSFLMGIGTAVDPVALLPPVGARDPATQPAMFYGDTAWDTVLHWLVYIGIGLMIGGLGFALLIWRPALAGATSRALTEEGGAGGGARARPEAGRAGGGAEGGAGDRSEAFDDLDARLARLFRIVALAGGLLFLFANLMLFVMQVEFIRYAILQPVTGLAPTPLAPSALSHEAPYKTVADIFRGYNGRIWIARIVLAVITLAVVSRLRLPASRTPRRWWVALAAALVTLATVSLTAHAAVVSQSRFAVAIDWSHMTVMSLWIGGLLPLFLSLREMRRRSEAVMRQAVVRRFSTMALIAVVYLAATGLFAAYIHVRDPYLLAPTTYGRALIAKLALFAALVVLGAIHRRVSIPHLDRDAGPRPSLLERILPAEIAVGCSLLAAVALMASLGTSAAVWPAHEALGIAAKSTSVDFSATFRAAPGKAGQNAVALDMADRRSGQPTVPQQVTVIIGGTSLMMTPVGELAPGSVQRFVSKELIELPEGMTSVIFTVERPTYPPAGGTISVEVPAALPPGG